MSKALALLLFSLLVLSSLVTLGSAFVQSLPKPSVPEFNMKFIGSPYNALVVTVKNQPYNSAYSSIYYDIRLKNHNAGNDSWSYPLDQLFYAFDTYPTQSNEYYYTNISLTVQSNFLILGTEIDVEVQAMLGNITRDARYIPAPYVFNGTTSDCGNTQTITVGENQATSPEPTIQTSPTPFPTDYTGVRIS
jgi:hypothetical protein